MVPFQRCIDISSPSCKPYEQVPSPIPFSPFSSSSSKRNERGTGKRGWWGGISSSYYSYESLVCLPLAIVTIEFELIGRKGRERRTSTQTFSSLPLYTTQTRTSHSAVLSTTPTPYKSERASSVSSLSLPPPHSFNLLPFSINTLLDK